MTQATNLITKLYLASKSPQRRQLLSQIGVDFTVLELDVPEEVQPNEDYLSYSQRVCKAKAQAALEYIDIQNLPVYPILAADTEVVYDQQIVGKPKDYLDAWRIWRLLAGQQHIVITSIRLVYAHFAQTITVTSTVDFDQVTDEEIHSYLQLGDYQNKSGAYSIQSYAGQYIQKINGYIYAIIGLPLNALRHLLQDLNHCYPRVKLLMYS